jgi:iron complex transport system ATP-binding protein
MTSSILEFRNVSFSRGPRLLLDQMSFKVEKQNMVALLGPNGVGKTTLLRLASRLLHPSSGEILLQDRPLGEWPRRELPRAIALVPQELEVPFSFRVEEIVAQGRAPYTQWLGSCSSADRRAVENAMKAVDVWAFRDCIYSELSGGERQRVKIAIGLAQQAQLMLLDEPTQHLDIGRQIELLALLRRLNRQGITIVAAVHDLNLVADNFSSAIVLTPEPSWTAGPAAQILRPDLLERAFSVPPSAVERYCLIPSPVGVVQVL